jgi:hypothetical protein
MNRHLLLVPVVLLLGLTALYWGLSTPGTAEDSTAPVAGNPLPQVPAARATNPLVPGITWSSDPFTMTRLGERRGTSLPFPPPPPVDLPPVPTMPFAEAAR